MLPNRQNFCCDNLWKSIIVALEKPGKLWEFFFSYFVATLSGSLLSGCPFCRAANSVKALQETENTDPRQGTSLTGAVASCILHALFPLCYFCTLCAIENLHSHENTSHVHTCVICGIVRGCKDSV